MLSTQNNIFLAEFTNSFARMFSTNKDSANAFIKDIKGLELEIKEVKRFDLSNQSFVSIDRELLYSLIDFNDDLCDVLL